MKYRYLFLSGVLFSTCQVGLCQCPVNPGDNYPKETWTNLEWVYSGSLSTTGITNAAAAWSAAQSQYLIRASRGYDDINILDDSTLGSNVLGQTSVTNQSVNTNCYNTYDACHHCMNANVMYQADVKLNPTTIAATASSFSLSTDWVVQETVDHEIGHVLGLYDINSSDNSDCSNPTIMSTGNPEPFWCSPRFNTPQMCDVQAETAFNAGWGTEGDECIPCGTAYGACQ